MPDVQTHNSKGVIELWEGMWKQYRLIPLSGKAAIEPGWQKPPVKKPIFDTKRFKNKNAGIPTGRENCLLVVDCDDLEIFKKHCQDVGWFIIATFTVKTSKGFHLYYQYPNDTTIEYRNKTSKKFGYNIRGQGGYLQDLSIYHSNDQT